MSTMQTGACCNGHGDPDEDSIHQHHRRRKYLNHEEMPCLLIPGLPDDIALNCLALARPSDHTSLACLNAKFNSLIKSGYLYGLRQRMGVANHWVYMVCDPRGWEVFETGTRRWMMLPEIPCDDCFKHADKESLAVGSQLLVFGRELWDFAVWMYSSRGRSWAKCGRMNTPRCLFGSGSSGSVAIIAGGSNMEGTILKSAELYDSRTGRWEPLPDMHSPRKLCSGFFMDGKFYVIGGMSEPTKSLTCGEEYDPQSRTWRRIEGMSPAAKKAAEAPPLVAVVDNELYAVEHHSNMVKKYEKQSNSWEVIGRLPVRADTSNGWGLAFKACGLELLLVGGQRGPEGDSIVLSSWRPRPGQSDGGPPQWKVLAVKEHAGVFVYNCAVMGC